MRHCIASLALIVLFGSSSRGQSSSSLDMSSRITYQYAIEDVYWQHRIWPEQNATPKPPLDAVISPEDLKEKAENGLRLSNALQSIWHQELTGDQLQSEINRMARDTRQPDLLRELFGELDRNPRAIAEVLARPVLAERLARNFYEGDRRFSSKTLSFEAWWSQSRSRFAAAVSEPEFGYVIPEVTGGPGSPDSWLPTHDLPDGNNGMTAVWTGTEMIVWGGGSNGAPIYTGSRYDPATDVWRSTNNSAITVGKTGHTAVWTGKEMIIWGGCDLFRGEHTCDSSTGERYSPITDTWIPTSMDGVPRSRMNHTAVWTGREMIVWGGCSFFMDSCRPSQVGSNGGRYNPSTDTWTLTDTASAPSARQSHTAVWTGSKMIAWGGTSDTAALSDGGVYDPVADSWTPTAGLVPTLARFNHTAVWTGREMIVWGGTNGFSSFNTGLRYNPAVNAWRATSLVGAPSPRALHASVWSGTEMLIWGGVNGITPASTGGRYNPGTNTWRATATLNAPPPRSGHPVSVWTGSSMIVWGGFAQTGGRYDPASDSWTPTNAVLTPGGRDLHTAVWTGTEMIVWGGDDAIFVGGTNTGGRYNLALDTWSPTSTVGAPSRRHLNTAVWTGSEMIIWGGGSGSTPFKTGGRYNPVSDTWKSTSTAGAPAARDDHSAVWTGTEMIVFGGSGNSLWMNSGGRYNPSTDTWIPTTTVGAPTGRDLPAAVWTGNEMIIWGGAGATFDTSTGGRYNPATDSWTPTSVANAPAARNWTASVWTGSKMLIWGGQTYNGSYVYHNDGALYDPASDTWSATSLTNAPSPRGWFGYVWTGSNLIVWGGCGTNGGFCSGSVLTGGRYDPAANLWTPTSTASAPTARQFFPAVWTGSQMIVWSGTDFSGFFLATTGGVYTPGP